MTPIEWLTIATFAALVAWRVGEAIERARKLAYWEKSEREFLRKQNEMLERRIELEIRRFDAMRTKGEK